MERGPGGEAAPPPRLSLTRRTYDHLLDAARACLLALLIVTTAQVAPAHAQQAATTLAPQPLSILARQVDSFLAANDLETLIAQFEPIPRSDTAVHSAASLREILGEAPRVTWLPAAVPPSSSETAFYTEPGPIAWHVARDRRRPDSPWRITAVTPTAFIRAFRALASLIEVNYRDPTLPIAPGPSEEFAAIDTSGTLHVVSLPSGRVRQHPAPVPWQSETRARVVGWTQRDEVVVEVSEHRLLAGIWVVPPSPPIWQRLASGRRASISPDGRWLVYEPVPGPLFAPDGSEVAVVLRDLNAREAGSVPIRGASLETPPVWWPDSSAVALGRVLLRPTTRARLPNPLAAAAPAQAPALVCPTVATWSPDDSALAFVVPLTAGKGKPASVQVVTTDSAGNPQVTLGPFTVGGSERFPNTRQCFGNPAMGWLADGSAVHFDGGDSLGRWLVPLAGTPATRPAAELPPWPVPDPWVSETAPMAGRVADIAPDGTTILRLIPSGIPPEQTVVIARGPDDPGRMVARGLINTAWLSPSGRYVVTKEAIEIWPGRAAMEWWVRDPVTGDVLWHSRAVLPATTPVFRS